jgi:diguanylate cyclase (GGDEF)-like protein
MKKILVIEDDKTIRASLVKILQNEEFDVNSAENGQIGLQLAKQRLPDIIICDVMMPELDGYQLLNILRNEPLTAAIPFIFLTSKATKADIRKGMNLGADDYLTKPFTKAELLESIATQIRKRTAIQEHNITAINQAEKTLNFLINYDSLTNLPNRIFLREQLRQCLSLSKKNYQQLPLLCIGLDRFSRINTNMGFSFGDLLLKAVSERLKNSVTKGDLVARLSTDRFAIVLTSISQKIDIDRFARLLLDIISQPFIIEGYEIFITASIGIALYPNNSDDMNDLINQADAALYSAKTQGGNGYQFYTREMTVIDYDPLVLEADLRSALEQEELQVYYHPQVDLQNGEIIGAEALLRWHHPESGAISPATFVPLAESTGLIVPIGEWVLRTACLQTKAWHRLGFDGLQVAVNLSGYQFNQLNLCQKIRQIITEIEFDPRFLELELTESIIVQNPKMTKAIFNELKELGIQISIDDFGTGYSSLSYLQQLPFDCLKIDQTFVRNITHDEKNATITKSVIQMAHSLNLKVVCEGVETEDELAFICENKSDIMQGYLFSKPLSANEFEKLLTTGKNLPKCPLR